MFYPDIHHGEHKCDTYLGPCPGPKPDDYLIIRRGKKFSETVITVVTHYINHGNTWQSADKKSFTVPWQRVGSSGEWDYIALNETDLADLDKNT